MNRINPEKLLLSQWSAVKPRDRERHFIATLLVRDADGAVIACELEAVLTRKTYVLDWHELKDATRWLTGWK